MPATRACPPRMRNSASPCPAVVTSATRAPPRWTTRFVPTVLPWPIRPVRSRKSSSPRPCCAASDSSPFSTPSARSCGVLRVLAYETCPVSSTAAQSVNVPPVSVPTKYMWSLLAQRTTECLGGEMPPTTHGVNHPSEWQEPTSSGGESVIFYHLTVPGGGRGSATGRLIAAVSVAFALVAVRAGGCRRRG